MIRLLLVDDHPIVREGLELVLGHHRGIEIVGSVGDRISAVGAVQALRPDVVLLDLELPDGNGLEVLQEIVRVSKVVVLTAYERSSQIKKALDLGASGFLLKGVSSREIADAVMLASQGGTYLQSRLASALVGPAGQGPSTREEQVLKLLALGKSNAEIADALTVTERTVKFHVSSLLDKFGAANRTEAVAIALERGLI